MSELDDLRALAARLNAAGDAERRRIEGELHDGIQQDLVAFAVNLQLARQLAETDVAATKTLLDEIRQNVLDALDGVRSLAHRVYPPILPLRGLADALRTLPVPVDAPALGRYPLDVEETVYFCCLELLRPVRVWEEAGSLCFATVDEIVGEDNLGVVRDRLASVGGRLTTSAGETRGSIPL